MAAAHQAFNGTIVSLCVLTTLFLQILSNLANDYGDTKHGADSIHREGPKRAVQAGYIKADQMKKGMLVFSLLSLVSDLMSRMLFTLSTAVEKKPQTRAGRITTASSSCACRK